MTRRLENNHCPDCGSELDSAKGQAHRCPEHGLVIITTTQLNEVHL